ncbi:MAG: TIGR00282 family metallophosphoesterase [Candidatus Omnitrophota bacterium]
MNILCIGDIVGKPGRKVLEEILPKLKEEFSLDCVVANAENAAGGSGLTPRIAEQLFRAGCNVLTMGDHVFDRPELLEYFSEQPNIIRPENFPSGNPGRGWVLIKTPTAAKVAVVNLLGRVFIKHYTDCPFQRIDALLKDIARETPVVIVDFHAEATSEKIAMGWFLDGRVSAVVGTHTHIQTADERVLPKGTAYITDLGMTGPYDSVIGQEREKIITRFLTGLPSRFEVAEENPLLCGVVIEVDETTGKSRTIRRIQRGLQ